MARKIILEKKNKPINVKEQDFENEFITSFWFYYPWRPHILFLSCNLQLFMLDKYQVKYVKNKRYIQLKKISVKRVQNCRNLRHIYKICNLQLIASCFIKKDRCKYIFYRIYRETRFRHAKNNYQSHLV